MAATKARREQLNKLKLLETAGTKVCSGCDEIKPTTEFHKAKDGRKGLCSRCKVCNCKRAQEHSSSQAGRNCRLQRAYGMSLEDYSLLLASQGGKCKICGSEKPKGRWAQFHVDHCHKDGHVRGILCNRCNTMLGMVDDDPAALRAALKYLEEN